MTFSIICPCNIKTQLFSPYQFQNYNYSILPILVSQLFSSCNFKITKYLVPAINRRVQTVNSLKKKIWIK